MGYANDDLVKAVKAGGSHFFDPDTMRFFGSRLLDVLPTSDGWVFITSELSFGGNDRAYTVRRAILPMDDANQHANCPNCHKPTAVDIMEDEAGFRGYPTLRRARTALAKFRETR